MENGIVSMYNGDTLDKLVELSRNQLMSTENLRNEVKGQSQKLDDMIGIVDGLERWKDEQVKNAIVSPDDAEHIRKEIGIRVYKVLGLGRRGSKLTNEDMRKRNVYASPFFRAIHNDLKSKFRVGGYKYVRVCDYDKCLDFVDTWYPEDFDELMADGEANWEANHPGMSVKEYLGTLF